MITRFKSNDRVSQAIRYGEFFETAGQVAADTAAGIADQTQQVLAAIDDLLSSLDVTKRELTRVQIWLADMSHFAEMNVVYERWLAGYPKPVRACVESRLATREYLVEIQAFGFTG